MRTVRGAYSPLGEDVYMSFALHKTVYIQSNQYASNCRSEGFLDDYRVSRDPSYIHVFSCPDPNYIGWAYKPTSASEGSKRSIIVFSPHSAPGGSLWKRNLGLTLVHEMGHYFNLMHTFGTSCSANADRCTDTPAQSQPHYYCDHSTDTCSGTAGMDPVWNFMDYSEDSCMVRFTACQVERMRTSVKLYRPKLYAASRANVVGAPVLVKLVTCANGQYRTSSNVCAACSNTACEAGKYRSGTCSGATNSYVCATCSNQACVAGKYRTGACAGSTNGFRCTICSNRFCTDGQYRTGTCTSTTNGYTCAACSNSACANGLYRAGSCGGTRNNYRCAMCSHRVCANGLYRTGTCSTTNGYRCTACSNKVCAAGRYRDGTCSGSRNGYSCPAQPTCAAGAYVFGAGPTTRGTCVSCPVLHCGDAIRNSHKTGLCFAAHLEGGFFAADARREERIRLAMCQGNSKERYVLQPEDGTIRVKSMPRVCMYVSGTISEGAPIHLHHCSEDASERFTFDAATGHIQVASKRGLCLAAVKSIEADASTAACWTKKYHVYVDSDNEGATNGGCYDFATAKSKCEVATDCHAVYTQPGVCDGLYRVTHGVPTYKRDIGPPGDPSAHAYALDRACLPPPPECWENKEQQQTGRHKRQ